ncbi:MAG: hypothetical protein HFI64_07490 [Lachnospiraceae bacterium]|nr:hypothetical protein [Lachnospiraceae bacterium]
MNDDTKNLLKECNAGTKMAVQTLDQLLPSVHDPDFKDSLEKYRNAHASFGDKLHGLANQGGTAAGDLGPMEKLSARIMTGMKLMLNDSDKKIASMLTDGCNMGIKSLSAYLNQYSAADDASRQIAGNIIRLEESMSEDLRQYL